MWLPQQAVYNGRLGLEVNPRPSRPALLPLVAATPGIFSASLMVHPDADPAPPPGCECAPPIPTPSHLFVFLRQVSCSQACYVSEGDLELLILLPLPPKCWDLWQLPESPVYMVPGWDGGLRAACILGKCSMNCLPALGVLPVQHLVMLLSRILPRGAKWVPLALSFPHLGPIISSSPPGDIPWP